MKKVLNTIAVVLVASAVSFAAKADDKRIEYRSSNLNVGMYEFGGANSLKLNLALTKDAGKLASIKLMNEKGETLYTETVGRKATGYNFRFDFSKIESGKYFIEVKTGERVITKEVVRNTNTLSY